MPHRTHEELILAFRRIAIVKVLKRKSRPIDIPHNSPTVSDNHLWNHTTTSAIAKGFNNAEIATMVGIGRDCVKAHLSAAFTRLNASSRSEAVAIAIRLGLLSG